MTIVTAYQPFNQLVDAAIQLIYPDPIDYQLDGNVFTQATYLAVNGETQTLYGRVTGEYYETATGVLFGYRESNASGAKYDVTGFALDWQEYVTYGQNDDTTGLQNAILRGNDQMLGSQGSDVMLGLGGNDTLYGGGGISAPNDGGDTLWGNSGSDVIYGNGGDDWLLGGSDLFDLIDGADTLYGGMGSDTLYGAGGSDLLYGNDGNDLIALTGGNDTAGGGSGNDVFVFLSTTTGYHTLLDFQQGDILSVQGKDFTSITVGAITDANGTFLRLGADSGITIAGVALADLDVGDFYFWS